MNQKLKRYDPNMHGFHKTDMCEDPEGDYVKFSDIEPLIEAVKNTLSKNTDGNPMAQLNYGMIEMRKALKSIGVDV